MPAKRQIKVFIASPGDLATERRAFKKQIELLNLGCGVSRAVCNTPEGSASVATGGAMFAAAEGPPEEDRRATGGGANERNPWISSLFFLLPPSLPKGAKERRACLGSWHHESNA